jgi:hypothetical protein
VCTNGRPLYPFTNDLDPALGVRLGDYFLSYLEDELRRLEKPRQALEEVAYGS